MLDGGVEGSAVQGRFVSEAEAVAVARAEAVHEQSVTEAAGAAGVANQQAAPKLILLTHCGEGWKSARQTTPLESLLLIQGMQHGGRCDDIKGDDQPFRVSLSGHCLTVSRFSGQHGQSCHRS